MDDRDGFVRAAEPDLWTTPVVSPPFVSPDILARVDIPNASLQLASIVEAEIVPRLIDLHSVRESARDGRPTTEEIARLARLVLDPNIALSSDFVAELGSRGLSVEDVFTELLEPAARCLGTMWDNDECSFFDVTLGVGRLQQLLSLFSRSFRVPAFGRKRRVCMISLIEEQHSFGVMMVESFLSAGGWEVRSEHDRDAAAIARLVEAEWFAVVGLTASSDRQVDALAAMIRDIRRHSRNPVVGIMVGGPPFTDDPRRAGEVGADATAVNAPAAVLLAQRLFDLGAETDWNGSFPAT
jgi:methanogenic corrinoid protein MtbC1